MNSTSMLNDIAQAHEPYTSTEKNTSTTIDLSFFSHAGGQGHDHGLRLAPIHQHDEEQSDQDQEQDQEQDSRNDTDTNRDSRSDESQDDDAEEDEFGHHQEDSDPPYESDDTGRDDSE